MISLETSHLPVNAADLKAAIKWFESKTAKQRSALAAKHKIVTYRDLIEAYKAGN